MSITKKSDYEKLTNEKREAYFAYLWKQQGLLQDFGVKQILGRKTYFADFELGFGVKIVVDETERRVDVFSGNSQLKEPVFIHKTLGLENLSLENHSSTLESLGLGQVFAEVLRQANTKTA